MRHLTLKRLQQLLAEAVLERDEFLNTINMQASFYNGRIHQLEQLVAMAQGTPSKEPEPLPPAEPVDHV